jgi:DNA-directed RNA polymerase specialized sigma24 family protein
MKDMIAFVRATVGDDEFRLLLEVVETSYAAVASSIGVPVGTLKARVSRAKARAREAWANRCGSTFSFALEAA